MKIPSIVKLPKYRKFKYKPRHYDPVLDDLNYRVDEIKRDLGEPGSEQTGKRRLVFRSTVAKKADSQALVIRLILIGVLIVDFIGYLYLGWGKSFQLAMLGEILTAYIWFRFLRKKTNNNA